jgi:hypothetical protein
MSENQRPVDNRSASQKINDLENALMALYQTADNMARDLMAIKDALKLLNNKLESVIKASNNGEQLTDEVINRIMIQNNVEELAEKVKLMVAQGVLASSVQVADDSFVVGTEIDDAGETINPRLQFAVYALRNPEEREKLKGGLVGDSIRYNPSKPRYKISEVYQIQQPKQEAPAAEQSTSEAPTDAPAEAAPAEAAPAATEAAPATPAAPAEAAQPDQSVTPAV